MEFIYDISGIFPCISRAFRSCQSEGAVLRDRRFGKREEYRELKKWTTFTMALLLKGDEHQGKLTLKVSTIVVSWVKE